MRISKKLVCLSHYRNSFRPNAHEEHSDTITESKTEKTVFLRVFIIDSAATHKYFLLYGDIYILYDLITFRQNFKMF